MTFSSFSGSPIPGIRVTKDEASVTAFQCDQMLKYKAAQKFPKRFATAIFTWRMMYLKIAQKVTKYLGYCCKKMEKSPNLVTLVTAFLRSFVLAPICFVRLSKNLQSCHQIWNHFWKICCTTYLSLSLSLSLSTKKPPSRPIISHLQKCQYLGEFESRYVVLAWSRFESQNPESDTNGHFLFNGFF